MQYILNMEIERYTPACGSRGLAPTAESRVRMLDRKTRPGTGLKGD